ncbi:MAG: PqqD family protein [Lachnospiraceae bacterium]
MFYKNENIVARKVHDSFFLIDIKQNYSNNKCFLYEINEVGYCIWNILSTCFDVNEIANKLYKEFDEEVERDILICDINDYLIRLKGEGYVKEDGGN